MVAVVRDYLASLGEEKATLIPGTAIALRVKHAQEIAQAALEVARREAQVAADAPEAIFLKELGTVLSTAAMKLVMLAAGMESEPKPA